jgi:hypothetical protein
MRNAEWPPGDAHVPTLAARPLLVGALLLFVMLLGPESAGAQVSPAQPPSGPPGPAARFSGTVMVGAAPAPVGAMLEAWVQGVQETRCARISLAEAGVYRIDVPSDTPGCGIAGAPVIFRLDGRRATPDGVLVPGQAATLNLTVSDVPPAPPAPPVPVEFAVATVDEFPGWVYLTWGDTSQLETRFELERWQPAGDEWRITSFTLQANAQEALDQLGRETGRVYYRLRACRDLTCSPWTDFVGVLVP